MTWGNPPKFVNVDKPPAKKVTPEQLAKSGSEDAHQMAVFCWAASVLSQYPQLEWMHSIPNGGFRNKIEATKLVATGARAGVWDIFLPYPRIQHGDLFIHGIYIEMKAPAQRNKKDGGLSKEQIDFGDWAKHVGYATAVCYTWEEARDVIVNYLEGRL